MDVGLSGIVMEVVVTYLYVVGDMVGQFLLKIVPLLAAWYILFVD